MSIVQHGKIHRYFVPRGNDCDALNLRWLFDRFHSLTWPSTLNVNAHHQHVSASSSSPSMLSAILMTRLSLFSQKARKSIEQTASKEKKKHSGLNLSVGAVSFALLLYLCY